MFKKIFNKAKIPGATIIFIGSLYYSLKFWNKGSWFIAIAVAIGFYLGYKFKFRVQKRK